MELKAAVQKYHWGKIGGSSLVAQFATNGISDKVEEEGFQLDPKGTYAELWMGTHVNGPSVIKSNQQSLSDFIHKHPALLGEKAILKFGNDIPFLFKILSVQIALSIQAHPNKSLGKILHAEQPQAYRDDNHKPEMAIALTPFEMLCGFRSIDSISQFFKDVPELGEIIGENLAANLAERKDKESLKAAFSQLVNAPSTLIDIQLTRLIARIKSIENVEESKNIEGELVLRLAESFPNDVGIFCVYFLQHFTLEPGQAVFLPANEPHAYLYGDCVECMAASDNTVRAGLTPKYKDVKTLVEMLTYESGRDWVVKPTPITLNLVNKSSSDENCFALLYSTPVEEFSVIKYQSTKPFLIEAQEDSISIMICVQGEGEVEMDGDVGDIQGGNVSLRPGTVLFLPTRTNSFQSVKVTTGSNLPVVIYKAFCTP